MADNQDYSHKKLNTHIAKLHEIENLLPAYAVDFIYYKASSCKLSTMARYAADILEFFIYLHDYHYPFNQYEIVSIPIEAFDHFPSSLFQSYKKHLESGLRADGTPLKNSETTIKSRIIPIKAFFSYELSRGHIGTVPVFNTKRNELEKAEERKCLSPEEISVLLHAVDIYSQTRGFSSKTKYRDKSIIMLLLHVGMKVSELAALNIDDVDFENSSVCVLRKDGTVSFLYFNNDVKEVLLQYILLERPVYLIDDERALFLSNQKKRMQGISIHEMIKRYGKIALPHCKNLTASMLRRTYGTRLYSITQDADIVSRVLGVKINTIKNYMKTNENDLTHIGNLNVYED